jgi:hypothetical protein
VLVLARLEPLKHFSHQFALGRWQPINIDPASDCGEKSIPIQNGASACGDLSDARQGNAALIEMGVYPRVHGLAEVVSVDGATAYNISERIEDGYVISTVSLRR